MALEAVVFQKADPFTYGCTKELLYDDVGFDDQQAQKETLPKCKPTSSSSLMVLQQPLKELLWDDSNSSSPENNGFAATPGGFSFSSTTEPSPPPGGATPCIRKRRRAKSVKNREEIENQRMVHIAVERNRRRQMNDYLAVLKSMMPTSYVQRGDQASIIGGAINFVKELEQLLQSLEARKKTTSDNFTLNSLFSAFLSFPHQYSTGGSNTAHISCAVASGESMAAEKKRPPSSSAAAAADVEVTMVERHANIKIVTRKHPKQLLKMVTWVHSLGLLVHHLNVTSVENMVLYSLSVKVEDNCQLSTVNEIAEAVYEMVDRFQEEATA